MNVTVTTTCTNYTADDAGQDQTFRQGPTFDRREMPLYPAMPYITSASPLPSLTLTLTKHHLKKKRKKGKQKFHDPSTVLRTLC